MTARFALSVLLILLSANIARAETVVQTYQPREGDVVRELPGNTTIVTNPNRPPAGVVIQNNHSLWYRTLYGSQQPITNYNYRPNGASMNDVNTICGGNMSSLKRNRCIRDVIEERQKLQNRYN